MKGIIDTSEPVFRYMRLLSKCIGYYIDVAAASPEEAKNFANHPDLRDKWHEHGIAVV